MELTPGSILKCYNNQTDGNPLVQVLDVKEIKDTGRYRLVISDGQHYQQAMLTSQLSPLVQNGQLKALSIIQIKEAICNTMQGKKVLILLQVNVIDEATAVIGDPQNVETAAGAAPVAAAAPAAAAPAARPAGGAGTGAGSGAGAGARSSGLGGPGGRAFGSKEEKKGGGGGGAGALASHVVPIASLNPYNNRWTIKARVTVKGEMRQWNNAKGSGNMFSVDLLDAGGGQIKATMFKDAADKFFPLFEVNKVFLISRGQLKPANKKWSRLPNDYELTLNSDSEVVLVEDDQEIEQQRFDFVTLERLKDCAPEEYVDVIGIVTKASGVDQIVSKNTQKTLLKRTLTLVDKSSLAVDLTLWGADAQKQDADVLGSYPVFAIKACRVSDFGGKSLNASFGSQIMINPDIKPAHELRAWFDTQGKDHMNNFDNISKGRSGGGAGGGRNETRLSFGAVRESKLGTNEKPDFFSTRATITYITNNYEKPPWYLACPGQKADGKDCNRKVTPEEGGRVRCEQCAKTFDRARPRYILNLMASDYSGAQWLTAFDAEAARILGVSAEEVYAMKEAGNQAAFDQVFQRANFKSFIFRIRIKSENLNDEQRVRCTILPDFKPINFKSESALLLNEIAQYT